jgi:hypothetical protein
MSDLSSIPQIIEIYKRFASPIAVLPFDLFFKKLMLCLESFPFLSETYGSCLFHKAVAEAYFSKDGTSFTNAVALYRKWHEKYVHGGKPSLFLSERKKRLDDLSNFMDRSSPS